MYQIFIVEDEPLIRENLRSQIMQLSKILPLSYCGEAGDGEMGLAAIIDLKPDIILTDIQMPFMDGLTFAKEVRKLFPLTRILFISGFDEFEYAKAAIQIQVDDYLLKPIKQNQLQDSLEKIILILEKQKKEFDTTEPTIDMVLELKKNHLLNGLFKGELSMNEALEKTQNLSYSFVGKKMTVLLARSKYNQNFEDYTRFGKELKKLFKDEQRVLYSSISSRFIKFLISAETKKEVLSTAYQTAQILIHGFQHEVSGSMNVSIGSVVDRVSEIPLSFQISQSQLRLLAQSSDTKVISYEDTLEDSGLLTTYSFDLDLKTELAKINSETKSNFIKKLLETQDSLEQTMMYRFFVLVEMKNIIQKKEDFPMNLLQQLNNVSSLIHIANNQQQYQDVLDTIIDSLIEFQIPSAMLKHNKLIKQAVHFIEHHYTNPDMSLNMVAQEVSLSPSHFSTIFSQSMGKTFIDYLTEQRIQQAKKLLLKTNLRLTEITLRIGYSDPNYFSFLFKKKQGVSPTEYRQKN